VVHHRVPVSKEDAELSPEPGFQPSHAYNRACLSYVDKVLETMAFGLVFWGLITILHRDVSAFLLLHNISKAPGVTFPDFEERVEAY
jgi:hypothetical protein